MKPPQQNNDPFDVGQDFEQFMAQQQQAPGQDVNQPSPPMDQNGPRDETPQDQVSWSPKDTNDMQHPSSGTGMGLNPDNLTAPSPEAQGIGGGAAQPTPVMPKEPTPASGQPFPPLQAPDPMAMVTPTQVGGGGSLGSGSLLGSNGGLTGGGLNAPGQMGSDAQDNILPLLLQLIASKDQARG